MTNDKKKSIHVSCPDAQVYIVLKPMICHYPCTMSWKTMLRHNKACIMTQLKSDKHCCVTTRPVSMTWMKSETMLRHDKPVSWQDWNLGNIVVSLQSLYPWHGSNLKTLLRHDKPVSWHDRNLKKNVVSQQREVIRPQVYHPCHKSWCATHVMS